MVDTRISSKISECSNAPICIICGHYGAGKTNIAVNLAVEMAESKKDHTDKNAPILADLDIVNPYFRSSDNADMLRGLGLEVIAPQYAGSNVDIPAIPGELKRVFLPGMHSVLDVGGDDSGAVVLRGYLSEIKSAGYCFAYVINESRLYIKNPDAAAAMLKDIEKASGLKATCIINNTNLGDESNAMTIRHGFEYAKCVCKITGLPLCATIAVDTLKNSFSDKELIENKIAFIKDITKKLY